MNEYTLDGLKERFGPFIIEQVGQEKMAIVAEIEDTASEINHINKILNAKNVFNNGFNFYKDFFTNLLVYCQDSSLKSKIPSAKILKDYAKENTNLLINKIKKSNSCEEIKQLAKEVKSLTHTSSCIVFDYEDTEMISINSLLDFSDRIPSFIFEKIYILINEELKTILINKQNRLNELQAKLNLATND